MSTASMHRHAYAEPRKSRWVRDHEQSKSFPVRAEAMRKSAKVAMLAMLLTTRSNHSFGEPAGAIVKLPEIDRNAIEMSLGKGSIGPAIGTQAIEDPSRFVTLTPTTKWFRIVQGLNSGTLQRYQFFPASKSSTRPGGWYQAGDEEKGFLEMQDDGSLVVTGVEDMQSESVTHYDPPEPFLPKGLAPGEHRVVRMSVRVHSARRSEEITHRGELTVNFQYLGAFRLTVPAGTFDAVLMKSTFSGHIGPAKLEDVQYRFFATNAGLLATIENRQVSAYLIYQSDTEMAKVLTRQPGENLNKRSDDALESKVPAP